MNPIGLSYVNAGVVHGVDGSVSARDYFHAPARRVDFMQASVSQMLRGGVRLAVVSHGLNDPDLLPGPAGVEYILRCFDAIVSEAEACDQCVLVRTQRDLRRARRAGKLAVVLHLTGCPVNGSFQVLDVLARLGVRACHPMHHDAAIGEHWYGQGRGLTRYGKQLVREMEARHILVDTAHASDRSFRDILRTARRPIFDSHTGCRAIVPSDRNRTDAQMKAIAATGGVVGVHFGSQLLADGLAVQPRRRLIEERNRLIARFRRTHRDPYDVLHHAYDARRWSRAIGGAKDDGHEAARATLEQLCDHIERMIEIAGIDHVCIGSDYALGGICAGVETAAKLQNLARALARRGYRSAELGKVLLGNLERLILCSLPR